MLTPWLALAVEVFVNTRMNQTLEELKVHYGLYKTENYTLRTKVRMGKGAR